MPKSHLVIAAERSFRDCSSTPAQNARDRGEWKVVSGSTQILADRYHRRFPLWAYPFRQDIEMDFEQLKTMIRGELEIPEWQPSDPEMTEVLRLIRERKPKTKKALAEIVKEVSEWRKSWLLEGIDNSDLNALLLMAAQQPKTK